jgi:hypothetical protein
MPNNKILLLSKFDCFLIKATFNVSGFKYFEIYVTVGVPVPTFLRLTGSVNLFKFSWTYVHVSYSNNIPMRDISGILCIG